MYTSVIIALKYIFVIVVNRYVGRRSVDNKAAILSYPTGRLRQKGIPFLTFSYTKGQGKFGKSVIADCERTYKASVDTLMPVYEKLFSSILNQGTMPRTWNGGLITPIYKSGGRSDPANYRGIRVYSCLGKLFFSILN